MGAAAAMEGGGIGAEATAMKCLASQLHLVVEQPRGARGSFLLGDV